MESSLWGELDIRGVGTRESSFAKPDILRKFYDLFHAYSPTEQSFITIYIPYL